MTTKPNQPEDHIDDPVAALHQRARLLDRLLDDRGRVVRWPKRHKHRQLVLDYLIEHIEPQQLMTEREVGVLLDDLHTFRDVPLLRRCLVDEGMLDRKRDGSAYWRPGRA